MSTTKIPKTQTVALVRHLGGPVEFVDDYPVKMPGRDEVLAKVLYTGVCQSGLSKSVSNTKAADHWLILRWQTSTQRKAQQLDQTVVLSQPSSCLTSEATKALAASSLLVLASPKPIQQSTSEAW